MKKTLLFLFVVLVNFSVAQDTTQFSFQWNEYNWTFEKDFKPGWYYGYGFHHDTGEELVKRVGICIQRSKKIKVDFISDTLGWNDLGYEIDTNLKIAPNPQVILYYANGKVKATVDILPFFVRCKAPKKLEERYDTIAVDDGEGNLVYKVVGSPYTIYDLPYKEFKIIKHGYFTYYDTLGNELSKSFYQFDNMKSGTLASFNGEYGVNSMQYFSENGSKRLDVFFDGMDSTNRTETLYYKSEIEHKIYIKNILRYERHSIVSYAKESERWYSENGTIIQSVDYQNCHETGFYFKLNKQLDTLERGYFSDGLKDGHWEQYDTSASHHMIFSGDFYKGQGKGKHHYFKNGILSEEIQYKLFASGDAATDKRYQKITNQKDLCLISHRPDILFTAKDFKVLYYENGKVKQKIFYDPYHVYSGEQEACFNSAYVYPYDYGILDGVYIPANSFEEKIPGLTIGWGNQKYDTSIIYSKINYDSLGEETSRLVFVNGRAFEGTNIIYDSNANFKSITDYQQGKMVKK